MQERNAMTDTLKILVTGANGFVGTALTSALLDLGLQVRMTGQASVVSLQARGAEWFPMPDLTQEVDWTPALEGMDCVVHLAGIAHRTEAASAEDWSLYDQVNHRGTRSLALALQAHPTVKRFLFISTVRVHGDPEVLPVKGTSPLAPSTPYDLSKVEAEKAVRELLAADALTWAILRPVLVYGPGNRGNMARLEGLLRSGLPIPLGRRENKRSFLFIGNLLSIIKTFLMAPHPPSGHTWIVADREAVSTGRLLRAMGAAMNLKPRLIYLPEGILTFAAKAGDLGLRAGIPSPWNSEVQGKLLGDFYVDLAPTMHELGWEPPFGLEEGLRQTYEQAGL